MLQQMQDAPPVIKCSAHPGCDVRTFLPAACNGMCPFIFTDVLQMQRLILLV